MEEFGEEEFELTDYQVSTNERKLRLVMKYLDKMNNPSDVFNDNKAIKCFNYIKSLVSFMFFYDFNDKWSYFNEHFCVLISQLVDHYANIIGSLLDTKDTSDISKTRLELLWNMIKILSHIVPKSIKLRVEFLNQMLFRGLLDLIINDKFVDYYRDEDELLGNIILVINWLSKSADINKDSWTQVQASQKLLKFGRMSHKHRLITFLAFSNISTDKEIDSESDVHSITPELTKYLKQGADEISSYNTKYVEMEYLEDDEKEAKNYYVHHVYASEYYFTLTMTGIILGIYKIAVNNRIKYDLYQQEFMKETIQAIISKGSDIEQKYALRLLAQLCFDSRVCDLVSNNNELLTLIQTLKTSNNTNIKSVPKICEQILWSIDQQKNQSTSIGQVLLDDSKRKQQCQIMISYNSASRALCLKIKEELEKHSFRVWIDVSEIHGSSLEAMARAVETSDFILMCVTEKYRQSLNCQAEAQYAFKLNKKIIPLIMQSGYENADGWMGIIMGDKIFVNFTKYSFEECIRRLLQETALSSGVKLNETQYKSVNISSAYAVPASGDDTSKTTSTGNQAKYSTTKRINDWAVDDVNKWFQDNNINKTIIDSLSPCDGQLLAQVYDLNKQAPEFYYQSISANKSQPAVPIRDILLFTMKLKNLFE